MSPRTTSRRDAKRSAVLKFRVVVLHDDYLTAQQGTHVARGIADDLGWGDDCELLLWNVELLDTPLGRVSATDASTADVVIVALRGTPEYSFDLKTWLLRWLIETKDNSAALVAVFENSDETAATKLRAFLGSAAHSAGKDFFSQSADLSSRDTTAQPREILWVL